MRGHDPDGIAQTEADHFMQCPGCGQWFDMRDLERRRRDQKILQGTASGRFLHCTENSGLP
jgi:hypothetical protein